MVAVATSSTIVYGGSPSVAPARTSSVDASYSDPDLLIREYFLSSSTQRAISRGTVITHINTLPSVFAILSWGASGKARDGYDGAVNLLAEIDSFDLLKYSTQAALRFYPSMARNPASQSFAENWLEILIKAIACAYKIDANQRLRLLRDILPQADRRMTKASMIDALTIISDEANLDSVKEAIEHFASDQDHYTRDYAAAALLDIS